MHRFHSWLAITVVALVALAPVGAQEQEQGLRVHAVDLKPSERAAKKARNAERRRQQASEPRLPAGTAVGPAAACDAWLRNVLIEIDPPEWTRSTRIGQTQQLKARVIKGNERNPSRPRPLAPCRAVQWSSSAPAIAAVSEDGVVRAMRRGNARILATDLAGRHAASIDLVIESAVPSDQAVNMHTTWPARRLEHAAAQIDDRIETFRNPALDPKNEDGTTVTNDTHPSPWRQGAVTKYQWYGDRVGVLSDLIEDAGTFRVVDRAREWRVLSIDRAADFQLFRRKIILLDGGGGLRVKVREIDDPWSPIASSGIRAFRAHMDGPYEVVTAVRTDGRMYTKVISGEVLNEPWVRRNVGGAVERFKVFSHFIAVLRTDGVLGVYDTLAQTWSPVANGGTRDFAYTNLGLLVLFDDGRLRAKPGVAWVDLAIDVESFKADGQLIAAQQSSGALRLKDGLHTPWRMLWREHVLAYALQVDETGGYIGFVPPDRRLRLKRGADGRAEVSPRAFPDGELGHLTLVADVRETPMRTIATPYPGGSRGAAPAWFGDPNYLRSYPDDQYQCMLDNVVPDSGSTHNCRWAPEPPRNCLFEDWDSQGGKWPNPVTCYGRFCGKGVPNAADWSWALRNDALDSFDQLCFHHDRAGAFYLENDDGAFQSCVVRYGIDRGRLTYRGRQVVDGDADWNARWATMPNLRDAIDAYVGHTSVCTGRQMEQFVDATAAPRLQDPPE